MRKSDKKIDKQLCQQLTEVCSKALENIEGFQWLTHVVNYSNFPKSLRVICVFDTNQHLDSYLQSTNPDYLQSLINIALAELNIKLNNIANCVVLDTEQNCQQQHKGNWAMRLS